MMMMLVESCLEVGGVNRQSNLKHTKFQQLKIAGADISDIRLDMSSLGQICLV
jgi:hypothetical protein